MTAVSTPTAAIQGERLPRSILSVLLLAGMSYSLAQTLVVTALPEIARQVGATASAASWLLTGFLLAASVATPIIGKLGDVYGKGPVLAVVMVVYTTGGVICAVSSSIGPMIAGRMLQGTAAGVFPLAFGIVRDTFPSSRIPVGLALVSTVFGIGAGFGLPLSGIIADNLGVEWLFWTSLIGVPTAIAALKLVPRFRAAAQVRVDWLGAALLSAALAAILLSVTEANDWGWGSVATLGLLAGGAGLLGLWLAVEARQEHPLIELRVLRRRAVGATNGAALLVGVTMFVAFLLVPPIAQAPKSTGYGLGLSVFDSALLILPVAVFQLLGPLGATIGQRIGFRTTLALGLGWGTAALTLLALEHSQIWSLLVANAMIGLGVALSFAAMANIIVDAVPQWEVGIATGINTVTRTVGGAFGAAIATAVLAAHTPIAGGLPTDAGYTAAFAVSAVCGLVGVAAALLVPAGTGVRSTSH